MISTSWKHWKLKLKSLMKRLRSKLFFLFEIEFESKIQIRKAWCSIRKHLRYRSHFLDPFQFSSAKGGIQKLLFHVKKYLSLIFDRQNETPADLARAAGHRELAVFIDSYPAIHPGSSAVGTVQYPNRYVTLPSTGRYWVLPIRLYLPLTSVTAHVHPSVTTYVHL
jgi:hypothetical protein